jgi:hypothetical protein
MRTIEEIAQLRRNIIDLLGKSAQKNTETIEFYFKGEKVGSAPLPSFTTTEVRHIIADIEGVDEYDDFHFVREDGTIRHKGSDLIWNGLGINDEDIRSNRGAIEGMKYQIYKNTESCACCGHRIYKKS